MMRPKPSSMPAAGSLSSVAAWMLATSAAAAAVTESGTASGPGTGLGYTYGQAVPVTCLNRTIDSGEHITDTLGKLQYIPFPTCNETGQPLALRYGVTETVNCTIASLSDVQYHLFEYYVHSDAPLTCRVPTAGPAVLDSVHEHIARDAGEDGSGSDEAGREEEEKNQIKVLDISGPAYTPITMALQGTLQRSHLHIWTDMNVLLHKIASRPLINKRRKNSGGRYGGSNDAGFIVAGTAYSVPEYHPGTNPVANSDLGTDSTSSSSSSSSSSSEPNIDDDDASLSPKAKESLAIAKAARDPWTAGHGTKVVRGEPLTFTFHVTWLEGGDAIGWPSRSPGAFAIGSSSLRTSGTSGFVARMFLLALAASIGALVALYLERRRGRRHNGYGYGWKGDGILGVPPMLGGGKASVGNGSGGGGGSGRMNGYGGYTSGSSAASSSAAVGVGGGGGGYGYGGYSTGKKD